MKKGFTLIEMLVVIGIIAILIGASIGAFSKMTKTAEKARAQELVNNTATALAALFQREGCWPNILIRNNGKQLNGDVALVLAKKNLFSLSMSSDKTRLTGLDKFGIITPWATTVMKRMKSEASSATEVKVGTRTALDHTLYYALDLNGDGMIKDNEAPSVGGETVAIRATAAVWCIGKSGGNNGKPWPYKEGRRKDDVYSWTYGQTQNVQ